MKKPVFWVRMMQVLGGLSVLAGTYAGFKYGQGEIILGLLGTTVVVILNVLGTEFWWRVLDSRFRESNSRQGGE